MKKVNLVVLVIAFALFSCKKEKIGGKIKNDPKLAQELRESPERITLDNNTFVLTSFLWRDFMPIAEKDGSKMMCINWLTDVDSVSISSSINLKKQYVIKDNEVWTAEYSETKNSNDYTIEGFVRNGPKWGPDIEVDVVCEFENLSQTYKILAKSQLILRTE